MSNSEPYSTLEVRSYSQLPEVVDPEQYQKQFAGPLPVLGQAQYTNGSPNPYPPAEGYYGHGVPVGSVLPPASQQYDSASTATYQSSPNGLYDANAAKLAYAQNGQPMPPTEGNDEKKDKRRICGVAPLTFYIILGVIIAIIVAAVVGGVVGSTASSNEGDGNDGQSDGGSEDGQGSGNSTTPEDAPLILSGSRLTSTNWTDPDGVVHRVVFFQDAYDAIIACQWDSEDREWEQTNLTEVLSLSTLPINAVSGTPLASAAIDERGINAFEVHLWYLDPTSIIRSVYLDGLDSAQRWRTDGLNGASLGTRPGSLLAATWQRPSTNDSLGNWIVAYQRPSDGAVKTANSSHWDVSDVAVPGDTVVDNSSLAIIPQRRGTFLDRVQLVSQGLGGRTTGMMQLSTNDDGWDLRERDVLIDGIPAPTRTQHFAVTMWDNWSNYLYLGLLSGGEMVGSHFDGSEYNSIDGVNFSGGPDRNFTAISMTTDAMLYAISNDEVLEYSVDTSFPSNLRFVGKVFSGDDD